MSCVLAQKHNAVPRPGLEPGPPDPESSALTIRPPRYDRCMKIASRDKYFLIGQKSESVYLIINETHSTFFS